MGAGRVAEAREAGWDTYVVRGGKTVRRLSAAHATRPAFIDLAADRIYAARPPNLVATNLAGKPVWTHDLGMGPTEWIMGAAMMDADVVMVWTSTAITGIDKAGGKRVYRIEDQAGATIRMRGTRVYLADRSGNPRLRRLDPATGSFRWMVRPLSDDEPYGLRDVGDGWLRGYSSRYTYFDPKSGAPLPVKTPKVTTRCVAARRDLRPSSRGVTAHGP